MFVTISVCTICVMISVTIVCFLHSFVSRCLALNLQEKYADTFSSATLFNNNEAFGQTYGGIVTVFTLRPHEAPIWVLTGISIVRFLTRLRHSTLNSTSVCLKCIFSLALNKVESGTGKQQ